MAVGFSSADGSSQEDIKARNAAKQAAYDPNYVKFQQQASSLGLTATQEEFREIMAVDGTKWDRPGGVKQSLGDARVRLERKRAETKKNDLVSGQEARLKELKERSEARLAESQRLSDELLGRLPEATERATSAVNNRLDQVLGELGFQADRTRQGAGAEAAGRGLSRSSNTADKIGQVSLAEAEKKAKAQEQAEIMKQDIRTTESRIKEGIADQTRRIDQAADISEMNAIQQQLRQFQDTELQDVWQGELDKLKLGLELNSQINSMVGDTFSDLGEIFGGFVLPEKKEE